MGTRERFQQRIRGFEDALVRNAHVSQQAVCFSVFFHHRCLLLRDVAVPFSEVFHGCALC